MLKSHKNRDILKRLRLLELMILYSSLFHTATTLSLKKVFTNIQARMIYKQLLGEPLKVTVRPMLTGPLSCLSVCMSVTLVYCGQTAGWIRRTWYGTKVDGGPSSPQKLITARGSGGTHFGAIHSPKFANLLKFYPRVQKRPCNIFMTFSGMQILSVLQSCKILHWIRAESGYQVH